MSHLTWRAIAGLILAPYVTLVSTVAPEHVHEGGSDHPQAVAHQHLQTHEIESSHADGPEFDHDDDHVMWLDSVFVFQDSYHTPHPADIPAGRFADAPGTHTWIAIGQDVAAPAHGPPRSVLSLRAPPLLRLS